MTKSKTVTMTTKCFFLLWQDCRRNSVIRDFHRQKYGGSAALPCAKPCISHTGSACSPVVHIINVSKNEKYSTLQKYLYLCHNTTTTLYFNGILCDRMLNAKCSKLYFYNIFYHFIATEGPVSALPQVQQCVGVGRGLVRRKANCTFWPTLKLYAWKIYTSSPQ